MLKTTVLYGKLVLKAFRADDNKVIKIGGKVNEMVKNLSKSKKSKNTKSKIPTYTNIGAMGEPIFLIFGAKEAFNQLWQAFIEALILQYFDPECHIRIETNSSGYVIGRVLSELSSDWVAPNGSNLAKSKKLAKSDFG